MLKPWFINWLCRFWWKRGCHLHFLKHLREAFKLICAFRISPQTTLSWLGCDVTLGLRWNKMNHWRKALGALIMIHRRIWRSKEKLDAVGIISVWKSCSMLSQSRRHQSTGWLQRIFRIKLKWTKFPFQKDEKQVPWQSLLLFIQ